MNKSAWGIFAVAVGMMAATAGWLKNFQSNHLLGPAGVKVGAVPIYDETGKMAAQQSVLLPVNLPGYDSRAYPVTQMELDGLPKDTTFGRRVYVSTAHDLSAQLSVVLMGTDHTSIHQPQYCLYAQGWTIINTERVKLPMAAPFHDIPAIKITATRVDKGRVANCLYVYWFVSGDKITSEEGSRLWSLWKTMLKKGELERWAYVSYFVPCQPGHEGPTFERLKQLIQASAPEFQLVKGAPEAAPEPVAARQ